LEEVVPAGGRGISEELAEEGGSIFGILVAFIGIDHVGEEVSGNIPNWEA
jgi:hypothetical protein